MADTEKRGRGRPKKTEAPAASKDEPAANDDGPPPAKRGRGRPKGTAKAKSGKKAAAKKPAAKSSRGRGRPPKKASDEEANSSGEAGESS